MLQTIAIPVQDVVWEEEGRELIIDGEIFDIDSYHIKDGYLFAAGILDKDETEFVKFLHKQTDESKGTTLFVQWILMSECVMNHFIPSAVPGNNSELQKNITFYIFHYNNPFSTVIIPPPKFHLS